MSLQTIDFERFLALPPTTQVLPVEVMRDCVAVRDALEGAGACIVRDPRTGQVFMEGVQDLVVRYFSQTDEAKKPDIHPELHYQVGLMPEHVETARDHTHLLDRTEPEHRPILMPRGYRDPKGRFFEPVGPRPAKTRYGTLNPPPVAPAAFPEWGNLTREWGKRILDAIITTLEMAAIGCGLPRDTFAKYLTNGPHLFAPTGSDLGRFGERGKVLAGWHYDLNFMTGHGPSNFPGLFGWTRDWKRFPVKVPKGCLLMQVAKQLEWLTGGFFTAGFHQVIVTEEVLVAIAQAKALGKSLWRCGNTVFGNGASDRVLRVLPPFRNGVDERYPRTVFGRQVMDELKAISMAAA